MWRALSPPTSANMWGFHPKWVQECQHSMKPIWREVRGREQQCPCEWLWILMSCFVSSSLWADKGKILFRYKTYLCPKHTPGGRLSAGSSSLVMVNPLSFGGEMGNQTVLQRNYPHYWWPLSKKTLNSRCTWGARILAAHRRDRVRAQGNQISFICIFKLKIITSSG